MSTTLCFSSPLTNRFPVAASSRQMHRKPIYHRCSIRICQVKDDRFPKLGYQIVRKVSFPTVSSYVGWDYNTHIVSRVFFFIVTFCKNKNFSIRMVSNNFSNNLNVFFCSMTLCWDHVQSSPHLLSAPIFIDTRYLSYRTRHAFTHPQLHWHGSPPTANICSPSFELSVRITELQSMFLWALDKQY